MSYIGNKPFINKCLGSLSTSEQLRLLTAIDSSSSVPSGPYNLFYSEFGFNQLQTILPDYGKFLYVTLCCDRIMSTLETGYLIRLGETEYGFLIFNKNVKNMTTVALHQKMGENVNYDILQEQLTTEEFRRVLSDLNDTPLELANLFEADKDIISKIISVYDEDSGTSYFTFPKGIIPIMWYSLALRDGNGTYCYPNYESNNIRDYEGNIISESELAGVESVEVILPLNIEEYSIDQVFDELLYLQISGNMDITAYCDWYKIMNPQPSGTKLYKHCGVIKNIFSVELAKYSYISNGRDKPSVVSSGSSSYLKIGTNVQLISSNKDYLSQTLYNGVLGNPTYISGSPAYQVLVNESPVDIANGIVTDNVVEL